MRAIVVCSLLLVAGVGTGCTSSEDQPLGGGRAVDPQWLCDITQADGKAELLYRHTPQDLTEGVVGRWSGRYPGGRMPAFDVSVTVAIADDAEALYGFPVPVEDGEGLPDEAAEDCAAMTIAAEVTIEHEDVEGVSFDTEASIISVRGFELGDAVTEALASSGATPDGIPTFYVQNTTEEPYQQGDDDEVEFLLSPDETLWILERQPPYRLSGQRIE